MFVVHEHLKIMSMERWRGWVPKKLQNDWNGKKLFGLDLKTHPKLQMWAYELAFKLNGMKYFSTGDSDWHNPVKRMADQPNGGECECYANFSRGNTIQWVNIIDIRGLFNWFVVHLASWKTFDFSSYSTALQLPLICTVKYSNSWNCKYVSN